MAGLVTTNLIWIAYAVAIGIVFLVAVITTYTWQLPRDRSPVVSTIAVTSLTALLATVLLLPVDIALVSATNSAADGLKKDWATPEAVGSILHSLQIVYYSLYSFDALLCMLIIPFGYFWYEEYDEIEVEEGRTLGSRMAGALKYTAGFMFLVVILFIIGFFAPAATKEGAHWDLDYYKNLLAQNNGEKALAFGVGLLITLGTLLYVLYTGAGLALLPMSFIKSAPSISAPELSETTASQLEQNRERQHQLEMRHQGRGDEMPAKERRELEALRREERTLVRRERLAAEAMGERRSTIYRAWRKICAVFRPIKLLGGIFLLLVSMVIWVSMLITGIDKAMNSMCKKDCGYILGHVHLFQPINWIFVQSAKAFPVDYVLMALFVLLFFGASISGIATVGIRFLWVRVFQIRKGRTPPQALLVTTVMLALIMLAINYAIVSMVAPQYATFGTQKFCSKEPVPGQKPNCAGQPDMILTCSEALDFKLAKDVCTPSVMSTFINRVTITWPFFGAVDYWAQFVFLLVFLVTLLTALFRTPKLNLAELDEDAEVDEEEGLLATTGRRFNATWSDITGKTRSKNYGTQGQTNGAGSSVD